MLKKYGEISTADQKTITNMIKIIVASYINIIKEKEITRFYNRKEEYINNGKAKLKEVDMKYFNKSKNKKRRY